MVQLVQGGFGMALLPRAAVERVSGFVRRESLVCDAKLQALAINASYRTDPTSKSVETVVRSGMDFAKNRASTPRNAAEQIVKGKPLVSKKSMV